MNELCLPSLGAEMDEGTILEWYVKPGDRVEYGDIIALLDTEKAEIEMEAFQSGTIEALLVEVGDTVPVGTPVASLRGSESAVVDTERPTVVPPVAQEPSPGETTARRPAPVAPPRPSPTRSVAAPASPTPRVRATPLARRIAREKGIPLESIVGSGPGGAIVEADISSTTPDRQPSRTKRRREIIAAAMTKSKREIPHYYLSTTIEIQNTVDRLAVHNIDTEVDQRILMPALLIKSVALAAKRFPEMNGHWLEDGFHPAESVHLGLVVSLRSGGLVVPTFRDADERSLSDLMAELRDTVGRARAGRLRSGELSDATITLTSLGDRGAETIFGVIYPPQVAIVGFGGVHRSVWAEGDLHGTRSVIRASLAADHRASDGQQGSRFLERIGRFIHNPEGL
jgi:pyruvate dehydrogenase E2 component (dihydrolipoamide acetyltransferase)